MDPTGSKPLPSFLFFSLTPDQLAGYTQNSTLVTTDEPLALFEDEDRLPGGSDDLHLGVVEAVRAERGGVSFEPTGEGAFVATSIPIRYVISAHGRFERQISAGGVLARGSGADAEFALMRTLPRKEAVARAREASEAKPSEAKPSEGEASNGEASEEEAKGHPDIDDPRGEGDRREFDRRSRPGKSRQGQERRRGRSRRMRRRRGGSRWGPDGRLELPKGKLEPGETPEQAAVREVREELGLRGPIEVRDHLSKNHYTFRTPDGKSIFKTVHYYLLVTPEAEPKFSPRAEEGIVSVEWWPGERAIVQVAFPNLKPVLERAWKLLQK